MAKCTNKEECENSKKKGKHIRSAENAENLLTLFGFLL